MTTDTLYESDVMLIWVYFARISPNNVLTNVPMSKQFAQKYKLISAAAELSDP
jgi:hypothetical protein